MIVKIYIRVPLILDYFTVCSHSSLMPLVVSDDNLPLGFPRIEQHPQQKAVERGRNAVITCQVSGNPPPTITWFKNNVPMDMSNSRFSIIETGAAGKDADVRITVLIIINK